MMTRVFVLAGLCGVLATAVPVSAQSGPSKPGPMSGPSQGREERPYRGLFGGGTGNTEQVLTFNGQVSGGYDDNILASEGTGPSPDPAKGAAASSLVQSSAGLSYGLSRSRVSFGASGSLSFGYYPTVDVPLIKSHSASLSTSANITKRTQFVAQATTAYQPRYLLVGLPTVVDPLLGEPSVTTEQPGSLMQKYVTADGNAQISHSLTRRISLSAGYGFRQNSSQDNERDLSTQTATASVGINLAKGLSFRTGYGESTSTYGRGEDARRVTGRNIDVGLDLTRALSITRRTTVNFTSGTTAIIDDNQTQYRFIGDARLNRELGRTWNAWAAYNRGISYDRSFVKPVFSDSISTGVGGLIGPRVQISSQVGTAFGSVGFKRSDNAFDTTFMTAGVQVGITRSLGVGTSYSYYRYNFGSAVELPEGVPRRTDRQSFRVYLSMWAPLFHRTRRPDASR